MAEKEIPLYTESEAKALYFEILKEVLNSKNLAKNLEKYLSIVASRYNYDCKFKTENIGATRAILFFEEHLVVLEEDFFNISTIGEFVTNAGILEHEFGHMRDFTQNGKYKIKKNNFGRCNEGSLRKMLELLVEKVFIVENKVVLKNFADSMYITSAEEVNAREKEVYYENKIYKDLKKIAKSIDENAYEDFIKCCDDVCELKKSKEKNLMNKHLLVIKENKDYVKKIYTKLVERITQQPDYEYQTMQILSFLQDSYYFYDKDCYDKLNDKSILNEDRLNQLILLNSKYGERDIEKVNFILSKVAREVSHAELQDFKENVLYNYPIEELTTLIAFSPSKPMIVEEKD